MKVLVACEFSGIVRDAFKNKGHDAWSCDLLPTEKPGQHYQGNVIDSLDWKSGGFFDFLEYTPFDLIIMHPPCTALAVSGNRWYGKCMPLHHKRFESIRWTMDLWNLAKKNAKSVCMENPVGVLPIPATQYIHPWQFGHGETKKTGLWLHNLEPLKPTDVVEGRENRVWRLPPSADRWKDRSRFYPGIAKAMADQWG